MHQAVLTMGYSTAQDATQHSNDYVLNTGFLAVVLFLTAISERFQWGAVRVGLLVVAAAMLMFGMHILFASPIA